MRSDLEKAGNVVAFLRLLWYYFDTKKWREQKCSVEILQHRTLKPLYSEYKKSRDKEKYLREEYSRLSEEKD